MTVAHEYNKHRYSIVGVATVLVAPLLFFISSNDTSTSTKFSSSLRTLRRDTKSIHNIQNDHRQLQPELEDPKTVVAREAQPLDKDNTCRPHVVFTTFICPDGSSCSPLRQQVEDNTYHVWSSFNDVTFKVMNPPLVNTNMYGVPILGDMYMRMMKECPNALSYTFINGDIIGTHDFIDSINAALNLGKDFLMVGQRMNVPWEKTLDVTHKDFQFDTLYNKWGPRLFSKSAEDYFTVTKNAIAWNDIPPLVIGRSPYDNWLVDHVYHDENVALVDASQTARIIHQTDEEGNWAQGGKSLEKVDTEYNFQLLLHVGWDHLGNRRNHGGTTDAEWETTHGTGGSIVLQPKVHPAIYFTKLP